MVEKPEASQSEMLVRRFGVSAADIAPE